MAGQIGKCPFFWVVTVLILVGTSNGLFGQLLYVGNSGDDTISTYVIDQDSGLLTEVLPRAASPGSPSSVAIHPSGQFVYVTNSGNAALGANGPSIAEYSIDPNTGALALLSSVSLTPGTGPQGATIDAAGKLLFVAQGGPGNVAVYAIDPSSGGLSPVAGSPFAALPNANKVVVHPSGKFAYVSTGATGQMLAFNIDGSGALTPVAGSPFAARNNLFWMAMDAAGQFLFAIERQDPGVLVYSVDSNTGALTPVAGSPFSLPPGSTPTSVAVDPAGKFLYVSTAGNGGVNVFTIGATGALSQSRSFGAIISAFDAILDPSGKFLYVPGQQANAVAGLAIDAKSGALSPLPQQFFQTGNAPLRGATILLSPPVIPPIGADSVFNYHSHEPAGMPNASVAQGSRIAISGKNIGPAVGVQPSDFPLVTQLGGVSIQIQSGNVTTAALMVFASNNFVTAVVPSTTPLGPATVTVTYNGRTTAPIPMTVVTTSVGIRTVNDQGSGPARARNATPDTGLNTDISSLPLNALNQSATPGQFMLVQATGLGPISGDETQNLTQVLDVPADVIVGNKLTTATLKVRVAQGSDFILFKLPDDVQQGCYVPLAIRAGGVVSNVASLSISSMGASCSDATGLGASDIDAAQKAGQIRLGTIVLGRLDLGPLGPMDFVNGIFTRYDFNSLLAAFSPGNNGQGIRGG
ncbi:MAG TPA: beta-propeller fold lactonase family protein, partial [Bryobacteraceae bacterium]|nr:beta-propeller fold lactonase family protein [Bryobacteraceae bacterium]